MQPIITDGKILSKLHIISIKESINFLKILPDINNTINFILR